MIEEIGILGLGVYKIEEKAKKGNDSMMLQNMTIEQLRGIQEKISQEVKKGKIR